MKNKKTKKNNDNYFISLFTIYEILKGNADLIIKNYNDYKLIINKFSIEIETIKGFDKYNNAWFNGLSTYSSSKQLYEINHFKRKVADSISKVIYDFYSKFTYTVIIIVLLSDFDKIGEDEGKLITKLFKTYTLIHQDNKQISIRYTSNSLLCGDIDLRKDLDSVSSKIIKMFVTKSRTLCPEIMDNKIITTIANSEIPSKEAFNSLSSLVSMETDNHLDEIFERALSKGKYDYVNEITNVYIKNQILQKVKRMEPNDAIDIYITYFAFQYRNDTTLVTKDKKLIQIIGLYNEAHFKINCISLIP
ncbi:MAG: hypothetical protein WCR97_01880 [Bacilli bacterium]